MSTLKFIGSGSAFNTKLGNNSAYIKFNSDSEMLLLDCGTTTFERIKENNLLEGVEKVHVAITHTHDDHIGSLASLILYAFYSHGQFAQPKVTVYYSDGVDVVRYLGITGCVQDVHYRTRYLEEGDMHPITNTVRIAFDSTPHVEELSSYSVDIKLGDNHIFYSGDTSQLTDVMLDLLMEGVYEEFYIDTCKADYEGNVHLSLRILDELVPKFYRHKVYCMHLDEGFVRKEARLLGFNVVENEFK